MMIEIEKQEYEELLEIATRMGIIRRMVNDEDASGSHYLDTAVLRQVIGMGARNVSQGK